MGKKGPPLKILTREDVERALKMTRSNMAAARYLNVSYPHYRRYAKIYKDESTGETLFASHLNQAGVGVPKYLSNKGKEPPLMDLIEGRIPVDHFDPQKIKHRLIYEALLEEKCYKCGFYEKRVVDGKVPIILSHKNGDKKNWHLNNLEFLCYNCSFLYGVSPITQLQAEKMENYIDNQYIKDFDWEIDDVHMQHLKDLGLFTDDENDTSGSEFISYL
jgi:hypothetical protein